MMSIKQSSLHYHTLAKLKAEQDESHQRKASTPSLTNVMTQEDPPHDAFETHTSLPNQPTETDVEKNGKTSLVRRLNPFKRRKKPAEEAKKFEVSPELATLAVAGYASTLNPALAAGLASKIDSQFFWDFTILDFVGMAFPRISRSLQRGALPYDPEKDPEAQKRKGLDKWIYIKRKKAENANWANLREEMLREIQAAPGSLLVPALVFGLVPVMSRNKLLSWMGRRTLHMSEKELTQEHQNIQQFLSEKPIKPSSPKDRKSLEAIGKGYVERVFKDIPNTKRQEKVGIEFLGNGLINPYYHMSHGHLKTLKEGLKDDELFGLKASLSSHAKLNKNSLLKVNSVSLDQIVSEIGAVQGKLLAFEMEHGAGSMFFNSTRRKEHALLTAKMQALYNIAEHTCLKVNAIHSPQTRIKKQMTHLNVMEGEGFVQEALLQRLRNMDKGRDLMVAGLRNFFGKTGKGDLKDALAQSFHTAKATKAFLSLGSFVWMLGWMWYLAHAIQKGREYPANRLVRLNKPKENEESKQAPVPTEGLPLSKKDEIRQHLKLARLTQVEGGKAS
ncbi:MAG: hypothetical protein LW809_04520 [Vampirovibrionales bacterium]|jgi:hypothetical protein|nr:hypothetical protein [Vampirovibrionales bacterium]